MTFYLFLSFIYIISISFTYLYNARVLREIIKNERRVIAFIKVQACYLFLKDVFLFIYYLPTTPLGKDITQGQFLSGV